MPHHQNRVWPRAELNTALITSLHGDRLPLVSDGGGVDFWCLLSLSPAWESPSGQHLCVVLGLGGVSGRR